MTLKEDLRINLTGKIDENSISIVMVELSLLLNESNDEGFHQPATIRSHRFRASAQDEEVGFTL